MEQEEKKQVFTEMRFDDAQYAQLVVEECNVKMKRNLIGIIISLFVPIIDAIVLTFVNDDNLVIVLGIIAVVLIGTYLIGGGLSYALKTLWRVTRFSFFVIPIFPINLLIAWIAVGFTGLVAIFLPIVFILFNRYQIYKDRKAARTFLECCRTTDNIENVSVDGE